MHAAIVVSVFILIISILVVFAFRAEIQHAEKDRLQRLEEQKAIDENRKKIRQIRARIVRKQLPKND